MRVVLTRQQMFTFGHRPETWQRVHAGRRARRHAARRSSTRRSAETSRLRGLRRGGGQLVRAAVRVRQHPARLQAGRPRPVQPHRHARARRRARRACARGGDGRAVVRAADGPAGAAAEELRRARRRSRTCRSRPRSCAPATRRARSASAGQRRAAAAALHARGHANWSAGAWPPARGTRMQMFARASAVLHADGRLVVEQRRHRHRHRHLHGDGADRRRGAWACRWSR